jgi:hypothetical protein
VNLLWSALLALQAAVATPPNDPLTVVRSYFDAMRDLDVGRMHAALADDYRLFDGDGSSRLHNRDLAQVIVDWERGMHARWSYRILSVRGDKIKESHGHLFVTAKSSQTEAVQQFKRWLRATVPQPDPALIGPAGNLLLTKDSVQPMLYWMGRWRAEVDASRNRR